MPTRIQRHLALPVDLFADEAVFELEVADIWHRDWVFACTVDAVADPGDHVPVTIGRQPIVMVRGDDYQVRALANVCSHRGAPLVDCAGRASRFSCPYHAWTYDTEGALLSVPYAQPGEVIKDDHGLKSFQVAIWHGLVFVCLNDQVEPFDERVAAIEPYVRPLGLDRLHHDLDGSVVEQWQANWKLVYANAVDSYSNFRVHAETIEPVSPTDAAYYLAGSARSSITGGESMDRADHLVIALPPSFVAVVYPDAMLWQSLRPISVGVTEVAIGMAGEQAPDAGGSGAANVPGWDAAFVDEDRAMCEQLQSSASAHWNPGPLLDNERALGDFHAYLGWRLNGVPPEDPVATAPPGSRPEPPL